MPARQNSPAPSGGADDNDFQAELINTIFMFNTFKCLHTYKDKLAPVHAIKAYRGRKSTFPLILNRDSRWA